MMNGPGRPGWRAWSGNRWIAVGVGEIDGTTFSRTIIFRARR